MRSLKDRLAGLQKSVQGPPKSEPVQAKALPRTLDDAGFSRIEIGTGWCYCRETRYDAMSNHGRYRFSHLLEGPLDGMARFAEDVVDASSLRFYDTESTGLGTGAGTVAFIHTVGKFEDDEFVIRQYFVDEFSAEEAVLTALEDDLGPDHTLVTFNGKSFDLPLLQARQVMYRKTPYQPRLHIDLLHPSRRLWKGVLQSVKLVTVEAQVLGLVRTDDLPGSEAPSRYFKFTADKQVEGILPVFLHNEKDVCSLVTLLYVLNQYFGGTWSSGYAASGAALARWNDEWDDFDTALLCYQNSVSLPDATWKEEWQFSLFLKRRSEWELAVKQWRSMHEKFQWSIRAAVELAKYYEHREKDLDNAHHYASEALERHRTKEGRLQMPRRVLDGRVKPSDDTVCEELKKRILRIEKKRERAEYA